MARVGASQVFFNVVAQWNTEKLISDTRTASNVMQAVLVDSFEAVLKPIDDMNLLLDQAFEAMRAITEATQLAAVEFDKFYGDVPKGSNEIEHLTDRLTTLGEKYAVMGDEAILAGARAAQVGTLIGRQNVDILVDQANVLSQISDFDAPAAMKSLIALQQQTNALYGDMTRDDFNALTFSEQRMMLEENLMAMNNTLNTVANNSVALESDLVESMRNFAAQGHLVGDSFAEMAAMSAVLLEAGEEQGASGRALRMMYARLGGDISGARTKMEQMNVAILDENGNMKSMTEIMTALHEQGFSELSAARKQEIAQIVAGNRHYVRFLKLMENHGRFTELAALGEEGLAVATEQAETAMENLANQLLKVEAESENARAALGERMLPTMIGMEEATRDTLLALDGMASAFGSMFGEEGGEKVAKGLGRMVGGFRQMQGFVKFGLTIRSLSIASEMYQSVQRSLQDILVANENLHSKTATYLRFGEKANTAQQTLTKRIRFQHQEIAKILEHKRTIQTQLKVAEQARTPILDAQKRVIEATEMVEQKSIEHSVAQQRMKAQYLTILKRVNSEVMLEAEGMSNLGNAMQEIYGTGKATVKRDALLRQTQVDIEMTKRLTQSQKEAMVVQHERGRTQHIVMQRLKSFNELTRAFTFEQMDSNQKTRTNARLLKMSKQEVDALSAGMTQFAKRQELTKTGFIDTNNLMNIYAKVLRTNKVEGLELEQSLIKQAKAFGMTDASARNYVQGMDLTARITGFTQQEFEGLMRAMRDLLGEHMHFDQILKTMAHGGTFHSVAQALHTVTQELNDAENETFDATVAMMDLEKALTDAGFGASEYARLLRELQQSELKDAEARKELDRLTKMMTMDQELLNAAMEEYDIQMQEVQQRQMNLSANVNRQMGAVTFGLSNMLGTALFAMGKSEAAMGSIIMFAGSMIPAIKQTSKALGLMITDFGQMEKAARRATMASAGLNAVLMLGVAAIGAYTVANQKRNESLRESSEVAKQAAAHAQDILSADTKVTSNEGLVGALGLTTKSFGELNGDLPEIQRNIAILEGAMGDLSAANLASAQAALTNLRALEALNTEGSAMLDKQAFEDAAEALGSGTGEAFRTMFSKNFFGTGDKQVQELMDLTGTEKGVGGYLDATLQNLMDGLVEQMRDGTKLTAEQLELLPKVFTKANAELLTEMNGLVITTLDGEVALSNLADSGINASGSIGTLTDDLANANRELHEFGDAKEELFFGGKFGNVTGSLYKQVVQKGVESLYVTNEVIMTNNFNGFFNEEEAARRIINVLNRHLEGQV